MTKKKEIRLESAVPGDEKEISRLIHELALYEKAPECCVATPGKIHQQLFSEHPVAECILARQGDRVVGFAIFFLNFSTWLSKPGMHLEDLFVEPEARKQGVGGMLLRRLGEICAEREYERMEWACLEWNELAKNVYRRIGAEPMEEWRTWRLTGDALRALAQPPAEKPAPKAPAKTKKAKPAGDPVVVYTDGGCRPNPGVGAFAAILLCQGKTKEIVGGEDETTNNRMEMLAAITALETLNRPCTVHIHTDSEYLKNGITKWIHGWKKKNWMRGDQPVKNVDLWKRLDTAISQHDVQWQWVPGHAGVEHNERCDELCTAEIERRQKAKRR